MTTIKGNTLSGSTKALVPDDADLMKALMKQALQEVLEAEVIEFLGASPREHREARSGRRPATEPFKASSQDRSSASNAAKKGQAHRPPQGPINHITRSASAVGGSGERLWAGQAEAKGARMGGRASEGEVEREGAEPAQSERPQTPRRPAHVLRTSRAC